MRPAPTTTSSATAAPSTSPPALGAARIGPLVRHMVLGLLIATVLVLLLLFAGSEDRGFIYIDF